MLRYMERSTIYYLKQKGWTNVQIAEFTGHHRDTVARVLRAEVEKQLKTRNRSSTVAVFDAQIDQWLDRSYPTGACWSWRERMGHNPTQAVKLPSTTTSARCAAHASRRHTIWPCALRAYQANSCKLTGARCGIWSSRGLD